MPKSASVPRRGEQRAAAPTSDHEPAETPTGQASGEPQVAADDVTPLDGEEFLAANRRNRERIRSAQARKRASATSDDGDSGYADAAPATDVPDNTDTDTDTDTDTGTDIDNPVAASTGDRTPGKVVPVRRRRMPSWRIAGSRRLFAVIVALIVVVVALAISTSILAYRALGADNSAAVVSDQQRTTVMDTAKRYAATVTTYNPADYGDLDRRIRAVSTPEFAKTYIQASQEAREGNSTAKAVSKASAKKAAIESMTADKAVVLVALDQTVTSPDLGSQVPEGIPYQSRVEVTLIKRDGRWLLDDLATV